MSGIVEHYQGLAQNLIESLGYDQALQVAQQYARYGVAEEIHRLGGKHRATPITSCEFSRDCSFDPLLKS
jgi:hypothetical protein